MKLEVAGTHTCRCAEEAGLQQGVGRDVETKDRQSQDGRDARTSRSQAAALSLAFLSCGRSRLLLRVSP